MATLDPRAPPEHDTAPLDVDSSTRYLRAMTETAQLDAVANALRRIVRAIRVSSHAAQDGSGISGAQLFVLQKLVERPGASLREVARETLTDESSVSVVVSRLVERGLLTRVPSVADRRRVELTPTAKGRKVAKAAPEPAQARLLDALRRVPRRRLGVVAAVLERVAEEMGVGASPASMFFERDAERRPARRPRPKG